MEDTGIEDKKIESTGKPETEKVSISALEAELQAARQIVFSLNTQIRRLKHDKEFPAFRDKYEGRYWKYLHGNENDEFSWCKYVYCRKVASPTDGNFDSFETDSQGFRSFETGNGNFFHLCEIQITRGEYLKEADAFAECFRNLTDHPEGWI